MKVVTVEQMRRLEAEAGKRGLSTEDLMERAGQAVARRVWELLGQEKGARVVVLVGPGNNGGDGLVAARALQSLGARVTAYLCAPRPPDDPRLEEAGQAGVALASADQDTSLSQLRRSLGKARAVVDAVLGTGKARPLRDALREAMLSLGAEKGRRPSLLVVALDLPTGLNADTGEADPATPQADVTITLGFPKLGLFLFPGAEKVGRLEVVDIGIPQDLAKDIPTEVVDASLARDLLPPRPPDSHKGTFGRVLVVAGSRPYIGAAYLACMGCYRVGAGLVTLAVSPALQAVLASKLTETTYLLLPEAESGGFFPETARVIREALHNYDVLLMGCGMGQSPGSEALLRHTLLTTEVTDLPVVLDADALNILSRIPQWWEALKATAVVTPHPGEMARLTERTPGEVQRSRIAVAREAAQRWQAVVVLKGAFTVVASPGGRVRLSPFANPGLASAGTGDVLAGAIAGLMAQGLTHFDAASLGVYLHGLAGERVREEMGEAGMLATDLLPHLPRAIRDLRRCAPPPGLLWP